MRPTGFSFTLRLLAILLVPLVGLAVLSFQRIETEVTSSMSARYLVEDARLQQSVAAVYGPAQLEQVALEGLAAIDERSVPRASSSRPPASISKRRTTRTQSSSTNASTS